MKTFARIQQKTKSAL